MSKVAIVFPGQGAQYVGMGQDIYNKYPEVKSVYEEASDALGYDMAELCFHSTEEKLQLTENTQPSILTTCIATYSLLEKKGIKADYFAGLSLGEYTALVAAGSLKFSDAVNLVKLRGKYMQEEVPVGVGAMAAIIGLNDEKVVEICQQASEKGIIEPANFNCPKQVAVAGETAAVDYALELANQAGALKAVKLGVSAPFHTQMLVGAGEKLKVELDKIEVNDLKTPVVSNVTAEAYTKGVKDLLVRQVSSPVQWTKSVQYMIENGVDTFIEVGPGKTLSSFIKKIDKTVTRYTLKDLASLEKFLENQKI